MHSADEVGCLHLTGWQKPLRPQLDMRIKNIRCYGRRAVSMSTLAAGEHAGVQRLTQLYLRVGGHPALVLQAKQRIKVLVALLLVALALGLAALPADTRRGLQVGVCDATR